MVQVVAPILQFNIFAWILQLQSLLVLASLAMSQGVEVKYGDLRVVKHNMEAIQQSLECEIVKDKLMVSAEHDK